MSHDHIPSFTSNYAVRPASGMQVDAPGQLTSSGDFMSTNSPDSSAHCMAMRPGLESPHRPDPINIIPVDLMAYIFHIGTYFDPEDGIDFPFLVSHVCRSWRHLALSTPKLWTTIFISSASISEWVTLPTGPVLPRASALVLRSQRCPLHIKLHLMVPRCTSLSEQLIVLFVQNDAVFMATFLLLHLGLPMLEKWRIHCGNPKDCFQRRTWNVPNQAFDAPDLRRAWLGDDTHFSAHVSLPRLKALSLSGVRATWGQWSIGNLTSLCLSYMSIADRPDMHHLRHVLEKNAVSLEELELFAMLPRKWAEDQMPCILLPKLRELRLGYAHQDEAVGFFMVLQMPSLKSLALCDVPRKLHHAHQRNLQYHGFQTDIPIELELAHVLLEPRPSLWVGASFTEQVAAQFLCPLELLTTMHSLKTLVLNGSDPALLQSLNQPVILPVDTEGAQNPSIFYCGSQITALKILCADYDDLVDFLYNRTEIARHPEHSSQLPVLNKLELSLEVDDIYSLQREFHGENVELRLLAREILCNTIPIPEVNEDEPVL
ncbi:hypothetical protein BU15DRAFT_72865 [Melanogaster broomeanus]|nr:hypothetical protein BU15DRAFT_72865 [Melanogaster broomeanus]